MFKNSPEHHACQNCPAASNTTCLRVGLCCRRRLWEAGLEAGSQPVVGVVGAGHIKVGAGQAGVSFRWSEGGVGHWSQQCTSHSGMRPPLPLPELRPATSDCPPACLPGQGIAHYWPVAGEQSTAERVQAYLQPPREEQGSPWVTAAAGAAVLGTFAYRRPRAAAMFAGACALMMAPYLGFMVITVNRFGKVSGVVVVASHARASGQAAGIWAAPHGFPPTNQHRQLTDCLQLHSQPPLRSLPPSWSQPWRRWTAAALMWGTRGWAAAAAAALATQRAAATATGSELPRGRPAHPCTIVVVGLAGYQPSQLCKLCAVAALGNEFQSL